MDWNNQVGHRIEHIFPRVKVSFKESWAALDILYFKSFLPSLEARLFLSELLPEWLFLEKYILSKCYMKHLSQCLWCYKCFLWSGVLTDLEWIILTWPRQVWGFLSYWQSSPSMQIWNKNVLVAKIFMMPRMGLVKYCNKSLWCIAQFPAN